MTGSKTEDEKKYQLNQNSDRANPKTKRIWSHIKDFKTNKLQYDHTNVIPQAIH